MANINLVFLILVVIIMVYVLVKYVFLPTIYGAIVDNDLKDYKEKNNNEVYAERLVEQVRAYETYAKPEDLSIYTGYTGYRNPGYFVSIKSKSYKCSYCGSNQNNNENCIHCGAPIK
jgi:hypothetical protein